MLPPNPLPPMANWAAFDPLHDEPAAWRGAIELLAGHLGQAVMQQYPVGSVLVAQLVAQLGAPPGAAQVLKLYPPFLRDHWAYEAAMLPLLHGRLAVPTPALLAQGDWGGWPWLLMSHLPGTPLTQAWPGLAEPQRLALLQALGELTTQVHALPADGLVALAPAWHEFITRQLAGCAARQQRTGLPAHLLAQLPAFLAGPLPQGPAVALTGEYTPMNLLESGGHLAGMYDFGDGLLGPRAYDWLGPLCFLAAGHAPRVQAFFRGAGVAPSEALRLELLRLLLLHRYSHLRGQLACPGWQGCESFEALAAYVWPL